jgi:hypothetical protein
LTDEVQRRAAALWLAACIVLVAAWLAYPPVGPVIALSGAVIGWMLGRGAAALAAAAGPVVAGLEKVGPEPVTLEPGAPETGAPEAASAAPGAPQTEPVTVTVETDDTNAVIKALRHDLRGILSPAMLIADRLSSHEDPAVQRAGAVVVLTVERAAARLAERK